MIQSYLVRYGQMRRVGRFWVADAEPFRRGEAVVLQTHRGLELGEVLLIEPSPVDPWPDPSPKARILHAATPEDLDRGRQVAEERDARYLACLELLGEGVWPFDLIDVEPLLDADHDRTVLYYLGPHGLDVKSFAEAARAACGLEIVLEPVGLDLDLDGDSVEVTETVAADSGCGSCGSQGGGCGSGRGTSGGGCSGCDLGAMLASKRRSGIAKTR